MLCSTIDTKKGRNLKTISREKAFEMCEQIICSEDALTDLSTAVATLSSLTEDDALSKRARSAAAKCRLVLLNEIDRHIEKSNALRVRLLHGDA
jgi:hypothetical protein